MRAIALVCMVPRSKASLEVLAARQQAVPEMRTTTHRPHLFQPTDRYDSFLASSETERERFILPRLPTMTPEMANLI